MGDRYYKDEEEEATEYPRDLQGMVLIKVPPDTFSIGSGALAEIPQTDYNIGNPRWGLPLIYSPEYEYISLYNIPQTLNRLVEEFNKLKEENRDIRRKLTQITEKPNIIDILDLPDKAIEEVITEFLNTHQNKEVFPSDIAFEYHLDAKKVYDICEKLKSEGKIE